MFLPTRAHIKEITEGQYRIRFGSRVPKDAVNLAYAHVPAVTSRENVLITDLSATILENSRNAEIADIYMHPDASLLLTMEDGTYELPTNDVLITNIFQNDVPLYYAQTLSYFHYDQQGPDEYGMYQGNGITIVDRLGKPIDRPYRVQLIAQPAYPKLYKIIVFTSFKDSESDTYSIVYNAIKVNPNGTRETMAGFRETMNLSKAFERYTKVEDVLRQARRQDNSPTYFQGNGSRPSYSKFYVPTPSVEDTRRPEFFRFQVGLELEIKGERYIWTTPWYSNHVFNVNSLTIEERNEYQNGNKILTGDTAENIMRYFADKDYFTDIRAKKKYFVISDNDRVKVFTRLDGSSPIFGTTNAATDQRIRIPMKSKRTQAPVTETGNISFRIRPIKGKRNTVANLSFVIDSSKSISMYDSDRGQRQTIMRDVWNAAKTFHSEVVANGIYFNYDTFVFQETFTSDQDTLLNAYLAAAKDTDITQPLSAIDKSLEMLAPLPTKFNRTSEEWMNQKYTVMITDGRFDSLPELENKIIEASTENVSLCIITFSNFDAIKAICARQKTLCIDALSPRLGTYLRYFFFDLAGLRESIPITGVKSFSVSPEDGDKEIMTLDHKTFAIPPQVAADKLRYGIEVLLYAHAGVSIYLKDEPVNRIMATYNGANVIPVNYMDIENVYKIIATSSYYTYRFNHTYAVRPLDNQQIRVLSPREMEARFSWYPRIKNGRFERNVIENNKPVTYYYGIPEYYRQGFVPTLGAPFMQVYKEKPRILNDNQIKLMYTPLFVDYDGTQVKNIQVIVNGKMVAVKGWSTFDGVVELDGTITQNDNIIVSYQYEEDTFVYRGYYDETLKRYWSLDLNPTAGHYTTILDRNDGTLKDVPSFTLINKTIYIYLKPTLRVEGGVQGKVEKTTLFHTFEKLNDPLNILIAKIHVRPNSNRGSIQFIDTRVRGGGLKPEINDAIMREFENESFFYWDIGNWDGKPYSENAVAVFRISRKVLKEYGGRFTKSEVEEKLNKHLALGVLPIIEFIEDSDELLSIPEDLVVEVLEVEDNADVTVERPTFRLTVEG